jgi:formylglycine-generating enzyme required for sulfatase activity/CheY-like chemotaxis protein
MVILLVDGNDSKRSARRALLQSRGHEVMEASGAQQAVAKSAVPEGGIDILATEVILPGGSFGFDLKDVILSRFPKLRVAYTTSYDLTGYGEALEGAIPLPVTAPDEDFIKHVEGAQRLSKPASPHPMLEPGTTLGHYQILQFLYSEPETETYHALQFTVQRPVALVLLKSELAKKPTILASFKDRERVKASITHPRVAPLYEAGEVGGRFYYTREMPPGQSLEILAQAKTQLSERMLTDILSRVAEAMSYGVAQGCDYRSLTLRDVFVDAESQASIVNVFRQATPVRRDHMADVQAFLLLLHPLTGQGKARGLLSDLASQTLDWYGLDKIMNQRRDALSERSLIERAGGKDLALPPSRSVRWLLMSAVVVTLGVVAFLGGITGDNLDMQETLTASMVEIPAGRQSGFKISKYEVTIAQYATFISATGGRANPAYDHPRQPKDKPSHKPPQWDESYEAASTAGLYNGEPIDLNHPVTRVDFWDAWAYAKWADQRLPSESEWLYAARGNQDYLFPWGNDARPTDANFGDDRREKDGGALDGFNGTSPADKPATDVSPFGVWGMVGNVQEWTSTFAQHPELPGVEVPVIKGGHYGEKSSPAVLTNRHFPESGSEAGLARGFRTAEDLPTRSSKS